MADFGIRRIVIVCDAVSENRAAIVTAAHLAALWNAAIDAVFVEDRELLRILALPQTRHVGIPEAEFDPVAVAGRMAASAAQAREAIAAAARENGVVWTFAVVDDHPAAVPRGAGGEAILIAEAGTRPFAGHWRPESVWLDTILRAEGTALLVRHGMNRHGAVVALVRSKSGSARRAVAAAVQLAAKTGRPLTLALDAGAPSPVEANEWIGQADRQVASRCRVEGVGMRPGAAVARGGDVLVLDADPATADAATLRDLVTATEADVLLVR